MEKKSIEKILSTNAFKTWLLSKRWFGDKSTLLDLDFDISTSYLETLPNRIQILVIQVEKLDFSKSYFLPLIYYDKIEEILGPNELREENITNIKKNSFKKEYNFVEAEYCLAFWKTVLFEENGKKLEFSRKFYRERYKNDINDQILQNLLNKTEMANYYEISMQQLGAGNTTNLLFLLNLTPKSNNNLQSISYVLKSYKEYSAKIEPKTLSILTKNNYQNAPKIHLGMKLNDIDVITITEHLQNDGNIGGIYWNELNDMMIGLIESISEKKVNFNDKSMVNELIKKYCKISQIFSLKIGKHIRKLHEALIFPDSKGFKCEIVESKPYLERYVSKINSIISDLLTSIDKGKTFLFYDLNNIKAVLSGIKHAIKKLHSEYNKDSITIQPIHQDLHFEQVLFKEVNDDHDFYFLDFEGDPQLSFEEKKKKFPIEKDISSFLRSLSYIKFNTFLNLLAQKPMEKHVYKELENVLYDFYFDDVDDKTNEVYKQIFFILNTWEGTMKADILKNVEINGSLFKLFTVERALRELSYEVLYRPNKIIVPLLGLKETSF